MKGRDLIDGLERKFGTETRRELADLLGMSTMGLNRWDRKKRPLTPLQVANMVKSSREAAVEEANSTFLVPIVEFLRLEIVKSKGGQGRASRIFPSTKRKYFSDLEEILKETHGIYIFYDTRGRALYAGKAKRLSLWREMNNALNRNRTAQSVYRVKHPRNNVRFRSSDEKSRQVRKVDVKLYDLAAYVTIYEVDDAMIDPLEALLVRAFANDLMNVRMEKF